MVLVDRVWRGQTRKLLLHADRNGFFYVLDRVTGEFLPATPFVYQNWNKGFDAKGRPIVVPGSNSSPEGTFLVYPTLVGGTNFQPPSYSPITGLFYLAVRGRGTAVRERSGRYDRGQAVHRAAAGGSARRRSASPDDPPPRRASRRSMRTRARRMGLQDLSGIADERRPGHGGNVLFGSIRDGNLAALDARTGKHLWHFQTGAVIAATPISYAVDGRQYVAVAAGNSSTASRCRNRERMRVAGLRSHAFVWWMSCRSTGGGDPAVRCQAEPAKSFSSPIAKEPDNRLDHTRASATNAFEMKVKGHNVLRYPHALDRGIQGEAWARVASRSWRPGPTGSTNKAFYANGKRYRVRHVARQRPRADSHSRLSADHGSVAGDRGRRATIGRRGSRAGSNSLASRRG